MWFEPPPTAPDWSVAVRHLKKADPRLAAVIRRVGPCTLAPRGDPFVALCQSIYSQQISTAIATLLFGRFRKHFRGGKPTPAAVVRLFETTPFEQLKACGLSRQKHAYIRDLADHFVARKIPVRKLPAMSDEEVIDALTAVNGIGRWTAEMFLMFVLNRPDVLPVDDLGLREGVREIYDLPARPKAIEVTRLAEPWRPWRSIATWYLWRRGVATTT
ncbi:DNA-3-methyladenine glycosylase 2 family protein [Humisphaera borealis]|uniref:DNA-3-methyladenine glycosylase II n=2 Tax=Humisphaera borealis TaxID=2807512 RepID=A0A7M2X3H3_9BACT|nr:DNA-3-methyladenine glycosylase 2 family protein [Humisphaera borealis]